MRESGVGDAICGPGTMVVHFWNAAFTRLAMMGTWWFWRVAFSAPFSCFGGELFLLVGYSVLLSLGPVGGDGAGVDVDGLCVCDED